MALTVLDQAPGPVDIVGHSYGGTVALNTARALGARVRSLVLIEPVAFQLLHLTGETRLWNEVARVARRHVELVAEGRDAAAARVFMGYWIGFLRWRLMPGAMRGQITGTMSKIAAEWDAMFASRDGPDAFAGIQAPTLLIRGTKTREPVSRVADLLVNALPNARLEEVRGAGHMSPLTHGPEVNRRIMTHIDMHRRAPPMRDRPAA